MSTAYVELLAAIARHRGVVGCMVVDERDGVIVDSSLQAGVPGDAVAALAASLYRKARRSSRAAGFGDVAFFQLDAERGRLCVVGRGDLVLVAVTGLDANVGIIRVEMLKALGGLA
jgi:predicted regulator of Ras-like GTPase activity (Roadblock/LC7/MglB family)